jgi:hypothetical protein
VNAFKQVTGILPTVYAWYGYGNGSTISGSGYYGQFAEQENQYLWFENYQATGIYS